MDEVKETGDEEEVKGDERAEYEDTRPVIEYDPNAKIKVMDPSKHSGTISGHTEYTLKGIDEQGEFSVTRRYKEFYSLRNLLTKNWPGFFIPAIPPKVKLGKNDEDVVQERCYLFNRFMRHISEIPYLWDSEELKLFLRPALSVSQSLNLLPAPTTDEILKKMQISMKVNQDTDDIMVNRYAESIRDFVINSKEIFPLLVKFKNCITQLEKQRRYQLKAYIHFADFLSEYETTTLNVYSCDALQPAKKMISDSDNNNMKEMINNLSRKVSNPFIRFKFWVKEEIIDLHALLESICHRNMLESRKTKVENKIKSANSELDKLNQGKKTLKTFWKSSSSKANTISNLTTFIAQAEKDVENYEKMIKIVTIYLHKKVIPEFKERKIKGYVDILKDFSDSESKNSNELYQTWSAVLEQIQKAFDC